MGAPVPQTATARASRAKETDAADQHKRGTPNALHARRMGNVLSVHRAT